MINQLDINYDNLAIFKRNLSSNLLIVFIKASQNRKSSVAATFARICFELENMVKEINKFEQIVVDTIIKLRSQNKRPDTETIFKDVQRNVATNWTIKDVNVILTY